ncbi:hypothetical protein SAMN04490240_4527 [Rhodococcus pyridinivorans]|nr:hypothetical protein SAMN04490240_4527 [Rhodococcus pyridinivorans]
MRVPDPEPSGSGRVGDTPRAYTVTYELFRIRSRSGTISAVRTTSGGKDTIDDVTYYPVGAAEHALQRLVHATAMQDTTDYESLRSAMDAEYFWRGVAETFRIADEAFRIVSSATRDRQDICAHVMARAADWVGTIELATEGSRLYGALVAYTQGVSEGYSAVEAWARDGRV